MSISMEMIKQLREETGAGVMDAKKALEEALSNPKIKNQKSKVIEEAKKIIAKKGLARAEKKAAEREAGQGVVYAYVHHNNQSGALVELACETDFVARNDEFVGLAKELAMQITSTDPENVEALMKQEYIRDPKKTIDEVVKAVSGKLGEKIELKRFSRMVVGQLS